MSIKRQTRQVGDRRTAIAAQLKRPDNTVVDVTSLTVKFMMVDGEGNTKTALTDTGITKTDATNGKVEYAPTADDVDTEGTFYGYFVTEDGSGKQDSFPAQKGGFEIVFDARY